MEYIYKNENIPTHFIKTKKFKTNSISIRFASNIDRSRITERVLIPSLLYAGSKKFNTKRKINLLMEELFDSSISFAMSKMGLSTVVSITANFLSDYYLQGTMIDEIVAIMKEVIFNPDIEDQAFVEAKVEEEKRLLKEYFESIKEEKTEYAIKQMKEHLYQIEDFGISAVGYLEDLEKIDGKTLYQEYRRMIETDSAEIVVTGDFESLDFLDAFPLNQNFQINVVDEPKPKRPLKEITETMKLQQAVLSMAFRTGITFDSEDYFAMVVANSILGTSPNNLLFDKLREQHSLCYYIRSTFVSFNGEIYIYSGLSDENIKTASELILAEIANLQEGNFDAELLVNAKKVLVNDLHESLDRQNTIAGRVYLYNQVGRIFDLSEVERKIKTVSKEDVMRVANQIELEMKYALTNEEDVWKK